MRSISRGALAALVALVAMGVVTAPAFASGKPLAETKPATGIYAYTATLNGVVNPDGVSTKYWFEYGTTTKYGTKSAEVRAGSGTTNLEESLSGIALNPATTYHFRVVAQNSNGTTDGADEVFTTAAKGLPEFANKSPVSFTIAAGITEWWPVGGAGGKIECKGASGKGETTGLKTVVLTELAMTGCKDKWGDPYTKGAKEGEIRAEANVPGMLVYTSKAKKEVGIVLNTGEARKTFIPQLENGSIVLGPIAGQAVVPVTGFTSGVGTRTLTLDWTQSSGIQTIHEYETEAGKLVSTQFEWNVSERWEKLALQSDQTASFASNVTIND